jgi:hypothetical protein
VELSVLVVGYKRNGSSNPYIKDSPELELYIHHTNSSTDSSKSNKSEASSLTNTNKKSALKNGKILNLTSLDPPNGQWKHYLIEESLNTTQATNILLEIKLLRPLDTSHIFIRSRNIQIKKHLQ